MNFDQLILEAAKSIMAASSALIRAANAAQRELIDQGKVAKRPASSSDDGQWSEGLISAARLVAAATHSLVEAAQNLVQGVGTEEMLISSAKQVASSTAQLLIACKVKSDPNSETGRRLQTAGNAVIKSTDNLVRAAQKAIEDDEEYTLKLNNSMVNGMTQEIDARSEVLRMERELAAARNKLTAVRVAKYKQKVAAGYATDDSDTDQQYGGSGSGGGGGVSPSGYRSRGSPSNFKNTTSTTTTKNTSYQQINSPRTVLSANPVPKPYFSQTDGGGLPASPILNRTPYSTTTLRNENLITSNSQQQQQQQYGTSTFGRPAPAAGNYNKANLEACVQDLHEKTFGPGGVIPTSTTPPSPQPANNKYTIQTKTITTSSNKTPPPVSAKPSQNGSNGGQQNYEGFTTR
jgi:talin